MDGLNDYWALFAQSLPSLTHVNLKL